MTDDPSHAYGQQMDRVVAFINAHLDEELSVDVLCRVAGFSKFHFHRQFHAYMGVTIGRFVRLLRLKRASMQLAFEPSHKVIEVALTAGFSSPEAFARAFKKAYAQSPTEFRLAPDWSHWHSQNPPSPSVGRATSRHALEPPMNIEITYFPETLVAVLEHHGPVATVNSTVAQFIEWRRASGLSPIATKATFGIPHSAPDEDAEVWHFDVCGEVEAPVPDNDYNVITKTIPGGRCAVTVHRGSTDTLGQTIAHAFRNWLPGSGEALRDYRVFFQYVKMVPLVAEHEQVTKVFIPLQDTLSR